MLDSAALLMWWVWTSALFTCLLEKNQLHISASSFCALEDLARKETAGSWLPAEHTVTFDPWLSAILQKRKGWGMEILAGIFATPFPNADGQMPILVPVRMD